LEHPQFHWGNPPPAAVPSSLIITGTFGLKFCGRVAVDFAAKADFFKIGTNPFHRFTSLLFLGNLNRFPGF
jgi:hypothetical protein